MMSESGGGEKGCGCAGETGEGKDALGDFVVRFRLYCRLIVDYVTVWFSRTAGGL
jgi:hypothetical protein